MEGLQKTVRDAISEDPKGSLSSISSFFSKASTNSSATAATVSAPASSLADHSQALIARPARHMISVWNCSKLCAVCFVGGIIVGYTLKRRVRRWASKLLKRIKDD